MLQMLCEKPIFAQPIFKSMATVKAIIRSTRKVGSAKIRFRLSDGRNTQLFYKSKFSVEIDLWDEENERIKAKKICPDEYRFRINKTVDILKNLILSIYEKNKENIEDSSDLENLIEETLYPKKKLNLSFFDIFEDFLSKHELSKREWKNYKSLERMLSRYQSYLRIIENSKFSLTMDIDKEQIEDFFDYVKNEYLLINENPAIFQTLLSKYPLISNIKRKTSKIEERGGNTIIKIKQRLKTFLNWAAKEGYSVNREFEEIQIGSPIYGTPYYITLDERDTIANFDLSKNPQLEAQRNIFIFQCYIGCRVGDLLKLSNANIVGDNVEYMPHKTMKSNPQKITVPLHPKAAALLERYKRPGMETPIFPFITAQKYNDAIKKVFTVCGITRMVTIINPKTGEPESRPINEIASSHLARRTFVGNLYKQVKDPNLIGKLSGHTENSRAFARYRDIDEETKKELIDLL
jgi:integrase